MAAPQLPKQNHHILVIDPSASHLAYVLASVDFKTKGLHINHYGMVWTKGSWSRGQRFLYMYRAFKLLLNGYNAILPSTILTESYFMNPRMLSSGVAVIPTINGLLELLAASIKDVLYLEVGASSWRSTLGIKPYKSPEGKRDYKTPTLEAVEALGVPFPKEIKSNITDKMRATPFDVSDALAMTLALAKENGLTNITVGNAAALPTLLIEELNKLSKDI